MSAVSGIEWTDRTWNPVRGCSVISPGCVNCYAMKQAHRFSGAGKPYEGLTRLGPKGPTWTGEVRPVEFSLLEPLSWRKPARVFVNSMSDLFHDDVPDEFIDRVFAVMAVAPWHTFQILTKRADRMRQYMTSDPWPRVREAINSAPDGAPMTVETPAGGFVPTGAENLCTIARRVKERIYRWNPEAMPLQTPWPLPNVWLGVSVENRLFRSRMDQLRQTAAAVRFVSFEPLLEDVSEGLDLTGIAWAIWGGESGPSARPSHIDWYRNGIAACRRQGVAPFMKQVGSRPDGWWTNELGPRFNRHAIHDKKGGTPEEWPIDLRVREFPAVPA